MKNSYIIIRCTEDYKDVCKFEAAQLGMSLSEYFRFCNICKLNIQRNDPDFFQHLLELYEMYGSMFLARSAGEA